jgi:iron complex transport system substrate-binding protein
MLSGGILFFIKESYFVVKSFQMWIGIGLLLTALVSFGCSSAPAPSISTQQAAASFQVVDQLGRTVKLDKTPQRIISLAPSNTEILYALGLGNEIVGVTSYDNYPPEVKQKAIIGGFSTTDIEKVVALSPDLIVAAPIHQKEIIPQLESRGLTVLGLNPVDVNGVSAAINLIGKVTGKAAAASVLVAQLDQRSKSISDATANLSQSNKPRVFYVVWHDPLMTAGTSTMIDDLITRAGGVNIASDLSGYVNINLETVIQRNPQIIVVISSMGDSQSFDYIKNEPRFQSIDAIKNKQIYSLNSDIFGRTTPRIVDGLEQIATLIHPEIFK